MKRLFLLAFMVLPLFAVAQDGELWKIRFNVWDGPDPVADVKVSIYRVEDGYKLKHIDDMQTNETGKGSFTVAKGYYQLETFKPGYSRQLNHVNLLIPNSFVNVIDFKLRRLENRKKAEIPFVVLEPVRKDPNDPESKIINYHEMQGVDVTLHEYLDSASLVLIGMTKTDKDGKGTFYVEQGTTIQLKACKPGYACATIEGTFRTSRCLMLVIDLILEKE